MITAAEKDALNTLGGRLEYSRKKAGLTHSELSLRMGWDPSKPGWLTRIRNYEHNIRKPDPLIIKEWADLTGFNVMWLIYGGPLTRDSLSLVQYQIPVLSLAEVKDYARLKKSILKGYVMSEAGYENCYALVITSGLWEPRLKKGDTLIIDPIKEPESENCVLAYREGENESTLKEYVREGEKEYLCSLSKDLPAIEVQQGIQILGVVIERRPAPIKMP